MHELSEHFFQKLNAIVPHELKESNFFSSGGTGYLENPTSDLMALFMGSQHDVPPWLLKALMAILNVDADIDELDLTSLDVCREVITAEGKYLDIVIYHQDFIIGIENKTLSAINNPFSSYQQYLESLVDNGQPVHLCILAPDRLNCPAVTEWPLLRYSQLVAAARKRLGTDQANYPFGKWHVFYNEFLNHLHDLSGVDNTMVMNTESQAFVNEHFSLLLNAKDLLKDFERAMIEEGKQALQELLPDSNISHRINNWAYDYKAIHLMPDCWGEGNTGISLVYYPDEETQQVRYYINGWIGIKDYPQLETLHRWVLDNSPLSTFLPSANKADAEVTLDSKELLLSYGTPDGTLDAARQLMKEMVTFISGTLQKQK